MFVSSCSFSAERAFNICFNEGVAEPIPANIKIIDGGGGGFQDIGGFHHSEHLSGFGHPTPFHRPRCGVRVQRA